MDKKIAILGAGPAGLAAAWSMAKKGNKVFLFERKEHVGGLGGGVALDGNIYDYGPHIFHSADQKILDDVKSIAGDEMFTVKKPILIKFMGTYFKYPLSIKDVLLKLPLITIMRAAFSFLWWNIRYALIKPRTETSETILVRSYGKVLYEIFFKSYIEHVWGMPPSDFSPKFAEQRIPRLSALSFLYKIVNISRKFFHKNVSTENYVENMEGNIYSTKRGFLAIAERMAHKIKDLGGVIYASAEVRGVVKQNNGSFVIEANRPDSEIEFDGVISTLPLNELAKMLSPTMDESALKASEQINFRALTFVGLLISKDRVLPASILYFRERSFNRITDLSYFGMVVRPKGHTIVIAEVTCGKSDPFWKDEQYASKTVIDEILKEGLVTRDMIKQSHVFKYEHAYPIYKFGFEKAIDKVVEGIGTYKNLETAGRQGLFKYVNTHIAMKMGYEAAESLESKLKNE